MRTPIVLRSRTLAVYNGSSPTRTRPSFKNSGRRSRRKGKPPPCPLQSRTTPRLTLPFNSNGVPQFTPDLFKDWVTQYARDGRDGTICIPNPRKFGKGMSNLRPHLEARLNRSNLQATSNGPAGTG